MELSLRSSLYSIALTRQYPYRAYLHTNRNNDILSPSSLATTIPECLGRNGTISHSTQSAHANRMINMGSDDRQKFGKNVRLLREALTLTQEDLAEASNLDRSYIGGVERGRRNPALDAILRLSLALKVTPATLFQGIGEDVRQLDAPDRIKAIAAEDGLRIRFKYDQYDAEYSLPGARQSEFDEILDLLKTGLANDIKRSEVVASVFLRAVQIWPDANTSDLWTFLVNRACCDRSNHPESHARLNLEQSWKRTSGWALERVLVKHYGTFLLESGISVKISNRAEKTAMLGSINDSRIIPDKADILLTYDYANEVQLLGVVHVKASIAERRTDDVPMSRALLESGHLSVFWTMDSKSFPDAQPVNNGEFGDAKASPVSDKRRDFEESGHFSACFSYNQNTMPTEDNNAIARISVCNFKDPNDSFSRFLIGSLHDRLSG